MAAAKTPKKDAPKAKAAEATPEKPEKAAPAQQTDNVDEPATATADAKADAPADAPTPEPEKAAADDAGDKSTQPSDAPEPGADDNADSGDAPTGDDDAAADADGDADELVKSPAETPEPVKVNEDFVRIEKANHVYMVTFYRDGVYGEILLSDVSCIIQKGSELTLVTRGSAYEIVINATSDEAERLFSQWRSIRSQRRNA